jgi:hypothetical protein
MTFADSGNVGIGTTTPAVKLDVNGLVSATGFSSISFASPSTLFLNSNSGGRMAFLTGGANERMTILDNGGVGIGVTPASFEGLNVLGHLIVSTSGTIRARLLNASSTEHICYNRGTDPGALVTCSSAAEYVPSIDSGIGFPETADLVSIAPNVKNPYGDTHGPFTVVKSSTACDSNLLGFILKPESGADGPKLNEHYLPLSIFGYFPDKVTMENGPIKRGDPITSSSKAGYGMKSIKACKIIGYALEDADEEGKIQVFSNLSEYSAPVVAELQSQIENLKKEKSTEVEELKARLAALEQIVLSAEKSNK